MCQRFLLLLSPCLIAVLLGACTRVPQAAVDDSGGLLVQIEHRLGAAPVELGKTRLPTAEGEVLVLNSLRYYLSHFRLVDERGGERALPGDPQSDRGYFLIDEADPASRQLVLDGLAPGSYWSVEFRLGIDEARNSAGAQTGVLDPAHGMFWTWHTGYIFFALEGRQEPAGRELAFHVGGDTRYAREIRLSLQHAIRIGEGERPRVRVLADLAGLFSRDRNWNMAAVHGAAEPESSARLAEAYGRMFHVEGGALAFADAR